MVRCVEYTDSTHKIAEPPPLAEPFDWNRRVSEQQPDLKQLTEKLIAFRDERDWRQFHSLKNLILSLNLEASELLELTQWKSDDEIEKAIGSEAFSQRAAEECADILLYLSLIHI